MGFFFEDPGSLLEPMKQTFRLGMPCGTEAFLAAQPCPDGFSWLMGGLSHNTENCCRYRGLHKTVTVPGSPRPQDHESNLHTPLVYSALAGFPISWGSKAPQTSEAPPPVHFGNIYKSYIVPTISPKPSLLLLGLKLILFQVVLRTKTIILKQGRGVVHSRSSCIKPRPSISSVPSPPSVRIKLSNICSFSAMDQANFIRRRPVRFRYLFHVGRARYHGLQEILWKPSFVPPRRNHLRHAIWLPGWSSIILIHCGQMVSKDQYPDCFCLLGYWIDVCPIQLPHISRRAN